MTQNLPARPPAQPAPAIFTPARWTPARQRTFLTALYQSGSVAQAARMVGMSPSSAHRLRRRLAGTAFDRDWSNALALHAQATADPIATQLRPQAATRR
ncbi:LysR family transcriptional regulator [Sphingobium sp. IP1]|uniref:LysR family transcriptional regulator n=1 Tax=Sphingobium sp. IP1 TaxID=2021637 RepID=UPI000C08B3A2|nr:LysR family transcriptional regulator [Sphingobium sp. IP1]PHP18060.1 LysR family transcriptional regulator [Sphingobium sp. IP1]